MRAHEAKQTAIQWVKVNLETWPGLRAAHLVGSLAGTPDEAEFPSYKDVDILLIFDDDAPMLVPKGPFADNIETEYQGLLIEAGLKPVSGYRSPEAVLANPEIAHHLLVNSTLYDPDGLLEALHGLVKRDYARRHWVQVRCDYEREGFLGILGMAQGAERRMGPAAMANLTGYSLTYLVAMLCVVTLRPPTTGGRSWLRAREILYSWGRPELYGHWVSLYNLQSVTPEQAAERIDEAAALFDLAVVVKRSPHPFGHKMHVHLRPYFIETSRALLAEGFPAEASLWAAAFFFAATDILQMDGPSEERPRWAERQSAWLAELGLGTPAEREQVLDRLNELGEQIFTLANTIIASNPDITD